MICPYSLMLYFVENIINITNRKRPLDLNQKRAA
jgi:hypothetical protein